MAAKKKTTRKTSRTTKRTAKRTTKRAPKRTAKKAKPKSRSKKPAFGGYAISFAGRKETVEQVFGRKPIPPSQMTKKIWAFVKAKGLSNK